MGVAALFGIVIIVAVIAGVVVWGAVNGLRRFGLAIWHKLTRDDRDFDCCL